MLTIITPTYNRETTLGDCYQSLLAQTCKDFLWLIVDDGSKDRTEQLVHNWIAENRMTIRYIRKENGGKASALNVAFDNLTTQYACCLDSDDTFYPDAVRLALAQLKEVENDPACCGLLALRNNPDGTVMGGKTIPEDRRFLKSPAIYLHYKTELICFYKTAILQNYRFPRFEGEKFVSPSWLDNELSRKYYFKTSWDKFCCCEYIADGLTKNKFKVIVKNPRGYTCIKRLEFEFSDTLRSTVKEGIMYDCGCILSKNRNWLKEAPKKGWAFVLMPLGYVAYCVRFRKIVRQMR